MGAERWRRSRWKGRSACTRRSARPRNLPCASGQTRSSLLSAVELRSEESRGCLQDLVGPPEFAVLPLEFLDARPLLGGDPGAKASVDLCSAYPLAQCLR